MTLVRQGARHLGWPFLRHASPNRFVSRWQSGRRCYSYTKSAAGDLRNHLQISPEVRDAIATNKPVVALESTIYTHGALGRDLPSLLESVVRQNGAVPATIGVLDGIPTVGLSPQEIDRMVDEGARKISRRDFAYIVGAVRISSSRYC